MRDTRRAFIKKNFFGGLLCAFGIPFLSLDNIVASNKRILDLIKNRTSDNIDWDEIRNHFPLTDEIHHFNTAGLGASPRVVITKICETIELLETIGSHGHKSVLSTHKTISKFLNVDNDEIAITRNTTEGMNIIARSLLLKADDEVLLTRHEHIGGAAPWIALQKDIGIKIKLIELDLSGKDNLRIIEENLTEKTKVVSFSHVTCTTGMRLPAKEIVELCRNKGIYSCIDGAQAVGMIPVDLKDINPDFYSCSGHKWLFGPKGTGVLFINKSVIEQCSPVFAGAYTDSKFNLNSLIMEYRMTAQRAEYGTRNVPIILGLGSAIDFISTIGINNIIARSRKLVDHFRTELASLVPEFEILTPENPEYSASIVTIRKKDMDGLKICDKLRLEKKMNLRGIYENNINGIRISFTIYNSIEEVDSLISALKDVVSE